MQVTTDYTEKENKSTLEFGGMQTYRVVHWLKDVLKDFLLSSRNLLDERLGISADRKDDLDAERVDSLFRVDTTFNSNARAAGATPLILVSAVGTTYPHGVLAYAGGRDDTTGNGIAVYRGTRLRALDAKVSVYTKSYDSNMLLAGLLEDFLLMHEKDLIKDCGSLSNFSITGCNGPTMVGGQELGSAETAVYQSEIGVRMAGYVHWIANVPGPRFRGVQIKIS